MKLDTFRSWKTLLGFVLVVGLTALTYFLHYQQNLASNTPKSYLTIASNSSKTSLHTDSQSLSDSYQSWKTTYVVVDKSNVLRVVRPENYNDTVSAGIASGMLIAVSMGDKDTFDALWSYAKIHFNNHGLISWHIDAQGNIVDTTSATDADEDMAYALIAADLRWGGYKQDATTLLQNMSIYEVEAGTNVLKPGDVWGGSEVTSPAYIASAYYPIFTEYTHDDTWTSVGQTSTHLLSTLMTKTPAQKTGLLPDWTTSDGNTVTIYPDKDFLYGYPSIKAVWRLGLAAKWEKDTQSINILSKLSNFFAPIPNTSIVDGYTLDGKQTGTTNFSGFVDAASIAKFETNGSVTLPEPTTHSYYADTYHLLTELLINNAIPQVVLKESK